MRDHSFTYLGNFANDIAIPTEIPDPRKSIRNPTIRGNRVIRLPIFAQYAAVAVGTHPSLPGPLIMGRKAISSLRRKYEFPALSKARKIS